MITGVLCINIIVHCYTSIYTGPRQPLHFIESLFTVPPRNEHETTDSTHSGTMKQRNESVYTLHRHYLVHLCRRYYSIIDEVTFPLSMESQVIIIPSNTF